MFMKTFTDISGQNYITITIIVIDVLAFSYRSNLGSIVINAGLNIISMFPRLD